MPSSWGFGARRKLAVARGAMRLRPRWQALLEDHGEVLKERWIFDISASVVFLKQ